MRDFNGKRKKMQTLTKKTLFSLTKNIRIERIIEKKLSFKWI